jgi:hypothetical protein
LTEKHTNKTNATATATTAFVLTTLLSMISPNTITIVAASSRISCSADPENPYCNSDLGRNGIPFCDLKIDTGMCYDRNDNPEGYCEMYGRDDIEFCRMIEGSDNVTMTDNKSLAEIEGR